MTGATAVAKPHASCLCGLHSAVPARMLCDIMCSLNRRCQPMSVKHYLSASTTMQPVVTHTARSLLVRSPISKCIVCLLIQSFEAFLSFQLHVCSCSSFSSPINLFPVRGLYHQQKYLVSQYGVSIKECRYFNHLYFIEILTNV